MIEEEPVYDTLFVHDTLYRHDTTTLEGHFRNPAPANKIHPQTVTFRGNPVFDRKQEKISSMDSIKKYGLVGLIILGLNALAPAQKESKDAHYQDVNPYENEESLQNSSDGNSRLTDSTCFYKYSIGLIISPLGGGPSVKYGISENCIFQTDFSGRLYSNRYSKEKSFLLYVFDISQSFLFQKQFAEKKGVAYFYMVGGGISGGVS